MSNFSRGTPPRKTVSTFHTKCFDTTKKVGNVEERWKELKKSTYNAREGSRRPG